MKVFILLAVISLFACNQSSEKENQNPSDDSLAGAVISPGVPETSDSLESLHNFWVLESINDKPIFADEFTSGAPYLNLDTEKNSVSGFAGCNGIAGSMKAEGSKIVFDKITSAGTNTDCSNIGFEKKYLNNLSGRTVTFEIQPGRLILKVHDASLYQYRKIR
jgi:heat shock protein HslJ